MFFALFSQCRSKRKLELQRRTHRKWRILHHTLEPSLSCTIEFKKLLKILLLILYSYLFFTLYSILQSIWNELIYFFIHSLEVVQVKTQLICAFMLRLDTLLQIIDRGKVEKEIDVSLKVQEQRGEKNQLIEVSTFFGTKLVKKVCNNVNAQKMKL